MEVCRDHKPIQHRDGKKPWCKNCGMDESGKSPVSIFDKFK